MLFVYPVLVKFLEQPAQKSEDFWDVLGVLSEVGKVEK